MARRPRQASPGITAGGAESVGVTILPGMPLPEWLEAPAAQQLAFAVPQVEGVVPRVAPAGGTSPMGAPAAQVAASPPAASTPQPRGVPVGVGAGAAMAMAGPRRTAAPPTPGGLDGPSFDWELDPLPWSTTTTTPPAIPTPPPAPAGPTTLPALPDLPPDQMALVQQYALQLAQGANPLAVEPAPGRGAHPDQWQASADVPEAHRPDGGVPGTPARARGTRRGMVAVAAVLVAGVSAAGGAAALVPRLVGDPAQPLAAPAADLTMPTAVGELVALSGPGVAETMKPLIGFGTRPVGITVTRGYGASAGGDLQLAAMATLLPATADAAGQFAAWSERTGVALGPASEGSGSTSGITCAATAKGSPTPGWLCAWSGTGIRGQAFVLDQPVAKALATTAQLRNAMAASAPPAA